MIDTAATLAAKDDPPAGIDRGPLEAWLGRGPVAARAPLELTQIAGGRSNLTFEARDADGRRFVIRRPPLGPRLASAHDVAREYRILAALHGSAVPVPRPLALCEDESITGAPFYAMELIDGLVLRSEGDARAFGEYDRRRIGERLVDTLATLHDVRPADVGLEGLGRSFGYVERQLKLWYHQWQRSQTTRLDLIDLVHERLTDRIPEQGPARIVHGDYRLDNVVVARHGGAVAAVLDWELCTLGDPLADLGLLLVYWPERGDDQVLGSLSSATAASGFPLRSELVARYAQQSGRDVSELDFFVALGFWKLAIILQGVYARGLAASSETDHSSGLLRELIERLTRAADDASRGLRTAKGD